MNERIKKADELLSRPSEWEYIKDLSKDPGNEKLLDEYMEWMQDELQRYRDCESSRHLLHSSDYFDKISFLEAQENGDDDKMQIYAAKSNPNWLAIVCKVPIINCGRPNPEERKRLETWWKMSSSSHREETLDEWLENHNQFEMDFVCPKTWDEMKPTENRAVRFCEECKKNVYFCDNIIEARDLGNQGCCIGIDMGVIRKEGDLYGECAIFGNPSAATIAKNKAKALPDRISAKRIMKKAELNMKGKNVPYEAQRKHTYGDDE